MREAVGYIFAYRRGSSMSKAEVLQLPAVVAQRARFRMVEAAEKIRLVSAVMDVTTNRRSPFFERRPFIEAVQKASSAGIVVAVADMAPLFRNIQLEKVAALVAMLELHGSRLWDAARGVLWEELPEMQRSTIVREAIAAGMSRGQVIKTGLSNSERSFSVAAKENARRGRNANVNRANVLAKRLMSIVNEEKDKLADGALMSPSALASALNERNVPSPRGGRWSHNSAKNLLERIRKLTDVR